MSAKCEYIYVPIIGRRKFDFESVKRSIRNVNAVNLFLIATPATNGNLVHPVFAPEFECSVHKRLERNRKQINRIALFYMFLLPAIFLWLGLSGIALVFFFSCMSIYIVGAYELIFIYSNRARLKEKVAYYSACLFDNRRAVFYALTGFLAMGLVQVALARQFDGTDVVLEKLAFIFSRMRDGEYFRIITAQFLHSGVAHWASNLAALMWFAALCTPVIGSHVFLVAVLTSTAAYMALAGISHFVAFQYDGVIGFSGGVVGLAGFLIGASVARHPALPKMLYISLLPPVFITFVCFSFVTNASLLLHFLGLAIGAIMGMTFTIHNRRWQ